MPGLNGFIIFSVGIIIAILGAAKVPEGDATWPTTVGLFAVGAVIAVIGLVLWRMGVTKANAEDSKSSDELDPETLLSDLMAPLQGLSQDIEGLEPDAITARVDELLDKYVLPFARVRQRIINKLGMEKGAEILVVVAYGERILNRVWSAAADGHIVEATACFPEAHEAFVEAQKLVESHG